MHLNPKRIAPIVVLALFALAGGWYLVGRGRAAASNGPLSASGTIETTEVNVSPELGGRVSAVNAREGDTVKAGDVLIQFDTSLLQTQRGQAAAALAAAAANYDLLKAGPTTRQGEAQIVRGKFELLQAQQTLDDLMKNADLARAEAELAVANAKQAVYDAERHLSGVKYPGLEDYQQALADAQDRLAIADSTGTINEIGPMGAAIQAAQDAVDFQRDRLGEVQTANAGCLGCSADQLERAQNNYNGAVNNLNTVQLELENAQTSTAQTIRHVQDDVDQAQRDLTAALAGPNARQLAIAQASLSVAQITLAHAQDHLADVRNGPDPDLLAAAESRVAAAQAALTAAESGPSQEQLDAAQAQVDIAQAALDVLDAQMAKLTLAAPVDAVVLSRSIEPGEVVNPGATLIVLGQLRDLTITVYVPEDQYGAISLGLTAQVTVDSYPGQNFTATVSHIADQAEFTPRNVQTSAGRKTTVFAIKLSIDNPEGRLKPGMPADVKFGA